MNEDRINEWEIRPRPDGSFGVYDVHGMVAGPFGSKTEAMAVALQLPKDSMDQAAVAGASTSVSVQKSDTRSGSPR